MISAMIAKSCHLMCSPKAGVHIYEHTSIIIPEPPTLWLLFPVLLYVVHLSAVLFIPPRFCGIVQCTTYRSVSASFGPRPQNGGRPPTRSSPQAWTGPRGRGGTSGGRNRSGTDFSPKNFISEIIIERDLPVLTAVAVVVVLIPAVLAGRRRPLRGSDGGRNGGRTKGQLAAERGKDCEIKEEKGDKVKDN